MKKLLLLCTFITLTVVFLIGCRGKNTIPKIGVSLGVGASPRWAKEKLYMEERAKELGAEIEVCLSSTKDRKTQKEVCIELIDSGIDVLIIRPKDTVGMDEVISYAKKNNVKIINYAGLIDREDIDLFVGYDCTYIGQEMGKYLSELVFKGDYIVLSGDPDDKYVSSFLYNGAMRYIEPLKNDINIILDTSIPKWNPEEAKKLVKEAIIKNNNKIDAILAPNDGIAGVCSEVIAELGITTPVVITGMDAQLEAVKRIIAGTQSSTIYMDGKVLAETAINEAYNMARGEKINYNDTLDNGSEKPIPASLIIGRLVIKENLDKILIDSKYYTKEEVYGSN